MVSLQVCVPNCSQLFDMEEFFNAPVCAYKFISDHTHFRGSKLPDGRIVRDMEIGFKVYGADQCVLLPGTDPMTCRR